MIRRQPPKRAAQYLDAFPRSFGQWSNLHCCRGIYNGFLSSQRRHLVERLTVARRAGTSLLPVTGWFVRFPKPFKLYSEIMQQSVLFPPVVRWEGNEWRRTEQRNRTELLGFCFTPRRSFALLLLEFQLSWKGHSAGSWIRSCKQER